MTDSSSETYELAPDIARFYQGKSLQGQPPSLWTLVLSQVTT